MGFWVDVYLFKYLSESLINFPRVQDNKWKEAYQERLRNRQ